MKALDWQRFFIEQSDLHGKVVFSVAELANVAGTKPHALNTELGRLRARGLIFRYAQGLYGVAKEAQPELVLPAIDAGAYATGFYALFRHHLVTQQPVEITCFTNRRHNRQSDRAAPGLRMRFFCVPAAIYAQPSSGVIALPEQALCDFVYLALRDGADPRHLVTFRNLDRLKPARLRRICRRYPGQTQSAIEALGVPGAYRICFKANGSNRP